MNRAKSAAWWCIPSMVCLAVYWPGLRAWFHQDDFAWLALRLNVDATGDLWGALFAPMAQGTIRTLSERVYFLGLYSLFGFDALPFRITAFLTQFANLGLAASITSRLTRSRAAGFWAAVFWGVNSALALPMSWSSAYNQILCAFFLLASFRLLLAYIDTGKTRYWVAQWAMFLLGFGALEVNVVYPALAAGYTLLCARTHFRKTLWLFVPSAVFAVAHWKFIPKPQGGLYAMRFDSSMLASLWTYWRWALGPERLAESGFQVPGWMIAAATALLTVAILGFAVWQIRKQRWLAAFLLLFFLVVIGPVLPLAEHVSDYYLAVPVAGLAMLGGWALVSAWGGRAVWKIVAVLGATVYFASSIPAARVASQWNYERSRDARTLVRGLTRVRELHPGKVIILAGVDTDLFVAALKDKSYKLIGLRDVFLEPGSETRIAARLGTGDVSQYVLPAAPASLALNEGLAVVYNADRGRPLRNVTALYRVVARTRWVEKGLPRRVDIGNAMFANQLGPEWYAIEGTYRWMPRRASVKLGGPNEPGRKLYVSGYCPARQVASGPLTLTVAVNNHTFPHVFVERGDTTFAFTFPLPDELAGIPVIEVTLEVDRTFVVPGDGRSLGLVFGEVAVR